MKKNLLVFLAICYASVSAFAQCGNVGLESGAGTGIHSSNFLLGQAETVAFSGGTLTDIGIRLNSGSSNIVVAVYSDNAGVPGNLLTSSASTPIIAGTNIIDVPDLVLTPGTYWVMKVLSASPNVEESTTGSIVTHYIAHTFGTPLPNPLAGTITYTDQDFAIWMVVNCCTEPTVPSLTAAPSTVCPNSNTTINISGSLNDATLWAIYTGSCGGTLVGLTASSSFVVSPSSPSTTYYVRGEGGCTTPGSCGSVTVTVEDLFAPVPDIPVLSDVTAECEVTSLTPPTATDNCAGVVTVTNDAILPINTQGTTVVTWTYDDGNGNTSTQTQNVIIDDVTPPMADAGFEPGQLVVTIIYGDFCLDESTWVLSDASSSIIASGGPYSCMSPGVVAQTISLISANGPYTFYAETQGSYADNVLDFTITCDGSQISAGTIAANTTNTFSNIPACIPGDGTLPDVTAECEVTSLIPPTATDNCGGVITVTNDATLPINTQGVTLVTWTYADVNGNTSTQTQDVIIDDISPPVASISVLSDVTAECEVTSLTQPAATDNCGGAVTVTNDAILPINTQGTTVVTWTYADVNGNTSTQTQNVIIDDITPPVADVPVLSDMAAECEITSLTPPTATDNCGGVVAVTNDASLPINTQGTTIVTWTYDDGNGNTSIQTQNVVLDDITPPSIICSGSPVIYICDDVLPDLTGQTIVNDNCAAPVVVSQSPAPGTIISSLTAVLMTASDAQNNLADCSFNVVPNNNNTGDTAAIACDVFNWYGVDYFATGTATHIFSNSAGCDSVVTLDLTINNSFTENSFAAICEGDSYSFGTQTLTTSGVYTELFTASNGCDSIVTLDLIVNPVYSFSETQNICFGTTYNWQGTDYSASGTYYANYTTTQGCDSIYELVLVVGDELTTSLTTNDLLCNGGSPDPINSIDFTWLATSCAGTENIRFYINGILALETVGDTLSCDCFPGIKTMNVSDPAVIALITDGINNFMVDYNNGMELYLSWAIATINQASSRDLIIADFSGGAIWQNPNLCDGYNGNGSNSSDHNISFIRNENIMLSVTGGFPQYSFNWTGGATTQNLTDVTAGDYYVTVTDSIGCEIMDMATINQPQPIVPVANITNATCFGQNDGSFDVEVTGGTPSYTYLWSTGQTTQDISGITAGDYFVTVQDINNCIETATFTMSGTTEISLFPDITDIICFGEAEGAINLNPSGGITPYSYMWSNNETTEDLTSLYAGDYTVTVSDANNCMAVETYTVNTPPALTLTELVTDASVWNGNDGAIDISVNDGIPAFSFIWSGPDSYTSTDQNISGLYAGVYHLTVTDNCGYEVTMDIEVSQPDYCVDNLYVNGCTDTDDIGVFQFNTIDNQTMFDQCIGGTTGYADYTALSTTVAQGGTYNLTIGTSNPTWSQGFAIWIDYNQDHDFNDIDELVWQSPGISNAPDVFTAQITIPSAVASGTTRLRARGRYNSIPVDPCEEYSYGETEDYTIVIQDCNGLAASVNLTTNASCFNSSDGSVDILVTGGNSPMSYEWGGGETSEDLTGIPQGNYILTVTDAVGCTTEVSASVSEPVEILISSSTTNANCGNNDGTAVLSVTNYVGSYTEDWGAYNPMALAAGTYTVTVTDDNFCTAVEAVVVDNAGDLVVTVNTNDALCFGSSNGNAVTAISGGTPPYTENWGTANPNALTSGNYFLTVTDNIGCIAIEEVVIGEPTQIQATYTSTKPNCFGGNDGTATLTVLGGTPGYNENWGGENPSVLTSGTYFVTITDANLCELVKEVIVPDQPDMVIVFNNTDPACFSSWDGMIDMSVTGGSPGYLYYWSIGDNSQDLEYISAGTYDVSVTDSHGCIKTGSTTLSDPAVISQSNSDAICEGDTYILGTQSLTIGGIYVEVFTAENGCDSTVTLDLTVNPAYSFSETQSICDGDVFNWRGSDYTAAGSYYDNYTTMNGCDSIYELVLNVNQVYYIADTQNICEGDSYNWQGSDYATTGTYFANYMTTEGCDSIFELTLNVNPVYSFSESQTICEGDLYNWQGSDYSAPGTYYEFYLTEGGCDSIFELSLTVNPVYYIADAASICEGDSIFLAGAWHSQSGVYTEVLSDVAGCDSTIETTLTVNPAYYELVQAQLCQGDSLWAGGMWQNTSGTYIDSLISYTGCDSIYETEIMVYDYPTVNLSSSDTICQNESVILDAGTADWYFWSNGSSDQILTVDTTGFGIGTHNVFVTAGNGNCEVSDTTEITIELCEGVEMQIAGKVIMNIYPNPVRDVLHIMVDGLNQDADIEVFDLTGKIIYNETLSSETHQVNKDLDMTSMPAGVYSVRIISEEFVIVEKVIVQ